MNFLVVVVFFASFVSDAAISAVTFAFLMAMLPVGVVGMSISTAVFPSLSQQAAADQMPALRASVGASLRMILFLAVPASVGLLVLAEPAVRLLLERGAFDAASTDLVVAALVFYSIGVAGHAATEILSRAFYAMADTATPVQFAVLGVVLNIALCSALVGPFGVRGLAAAASIAALVECALLWRSLQARLGGLDRRHMQRSLLRTAAASAVLGEVALLIAFALREAGTDETTTAGAVVIAVVAGGGGLLAFVLVAAVTRSEEYQAIRARLSR